jgi:hypothetical protein
MGFPCNRASPPLAAVLASENHIMRDSEMELETRIEPSLSLPPRDQELRIMAVCTSD